MKSLLLDQINTVCRRKGYSRATVKTYRHWCGRMLLWAKASNGGVWQHPDEIGRAEIEQWLTHLAVVGNVSPNSQNVAFQAVLFLFREILKREIKDVNALRAKQPQRLPTFLSVREVSKLMAALTGQHLLIAQLLYGCGLRIGETLSLRIKDIDFDNRQIVLRAAKGAKDRVVGMPQRLVEPLQMQLESIRRLHGDDFNNGCNRVELPYSYAKKSPTACGELAWYWLFCSHKLSRHPVDKWLGRYHIDASNFGRTLKRAAKRTEILKDVHPHCLRHSYATHTLNQGTDIRSLQKLLGHSDVRTTMIYTHVELAGVTSEISPLDRLPETA